MCAAKNVKAINQFNTINQSINQSI